MLFDFLFVPTGSPQKRKKEKKAAACSGSGERSTETEVCRSVVHSAAFQGNPRGDVNFLPTLEPSVAGSNWGEVCQGTAGWPVLN